MKPLGFHFKLGVKKMVQINLCNCSPLQRKQIVGKLQCTIICDQRKDQRPTSKYQEKLLVVKYFQLVSQAAIPLAQELFQT